MSDISLLFMISSPLPARLRHIGTGSMPSATIDNNSHYLPIVKPIMEPTATHLAARALISFDF
jgi:hypothetical protein